jgi:hypothetical protein
MEQKSDAVMCFRLVYSGGVKEKIPVQTFLSLALRFLTEDPLVDEDPRLELIELLAEMEAKGTMDGQNRCGRRYYTHPLLPTGPARNPNDFLMRVGRAMLSDIDFCRLVILVLTATDLMVDEEGNDIDPRTMFMAAGAILAVKRESDAQYITIGGH